MTVTRVANKVLDTINSLLEYMMGIFMVVLVAIVFSEVIRRYIFNDPTHWSSELCRFILIWMTFTGASIVTRLATHLSMGFTIHRFVNKKLSKVIKVFVSVCITVVMIIITYYSAKVTLLAGFRAAPMLQIPMYYPWAALPVNAAIMVVYMIAETIKHIYEKETEKEEEASV